MLRDYIYDTKFQIYIIDKSIDILNYVDIISFDDNKIIIECPNCNLIIKGIDLTISKMLERELLIKGNIEYIEFR